MMPLGQTGMDVRSDILGDAPVAGDNQLAHQNASGSLKLLTLHREEMHKKVTMG